MFLQNALSQQFMAFHVAIIDDCNRAARPEQTDAMVLRLRNNALALGRLQLPMLAVSRDDDRRGTVSALEPAAASEPEGAPELALEPARQSKPQPVVEPRMQSAAPDSHRVLNGDALCRFVSGRLEPSESPHRVWQDLHAADSRPRQRKAALPKPGFRMPSG
jgi:hypothetical protein